MMQSFMPPPEMFEERRIVFRVTGAEAEGRGLPLVVRSAGAYRVRADFREEFAEARWFTQLYWTLEGSGWFRVGEKRVRVRAGEVFLYWPGERHVVGAGGAGGWAYRWITFDGRDTLPVLEMFGLGRGGAAGECPEEAFDRVEAALASPTREGMRAASVAAYAILEAAGRGGSGRGGEAGEAETMRAALDAAYRRSDAGVAEVAAELGLHRTTLLRNFAARFGVTPSGYLARRRLQHALSLLRTTAMPVAEVAAAAGFRSPEYLARVVRAETGRSPGEFRAGGEER
jgi:AraC-like DNA-binding protein